MQIEHSNEEMLVLSTRTDKDKITHFLKYNLSVFIRFTFQKNECSFQNSTREKKEWLLFKTMKFVPLDAKTGLHTFRKL